VCAPDPGGADDPEISTRPRPHGSGTSVDATALPGPAVPGLRRSAHVVALPQRAGHGRDALAPRRTGPTTRDSRGGTSEAGSCLPSQGNAFHDPGQCGTMKLLPSTGDGAPRPPAVDSPSWRVRSPVSHE